MPSALIIRGFADVANQPPPEPCGEGTDLS